jgi:hypothetical protein
MSIVIVLFCVSQRMAVRETEGLEWIKGDGMGMGMGMGVPAEEVINSADLVQVSQILCISYIDVLYAILILNECI